MKKAGVMIVDDEPMTRLGLKTFVEDEPQLDYCGEATRTATALEKLGSLEPDLVILDIALEGNRGIEFIQEAQKQSDVIIFTRREETIYAERCIRSGARAYISKREPLELIQQAIQQVLAGEIYLGERVQKKLVNGLHASPKKVNLGEVDKLTDRELEVFELLGQGCSTQEAAKRLGVSMKTVQGYHITIRKRLGLKHSNLLIRRAVHYVLEGE